MPMKTYPMASIMLYDTRPCAPPNVLQVCSDEKIAAGACCGSPFHASPAVRLEAAERVIDEARRELYRVIGRISTAVGDLPLKLDDGTEARPVVDISRALTALDGARIWAIAQLVKLGDPQDNL